MTTLSGWGCNQLAECELVQPEGHKQISKAMTADSLIARGLGRSYGDPAINEGGRVVSMAAFDRYIDFDPTTGTLTCEAGVSLSQILTDFVPKGFFPNITPGTKFVTLGGCIANDVHGKAHHDQGCFSNSVISFDLLLADSTVKTCSRTENSELFWACFGGMGLLGMVLRATITLRPITTSYFTQKTFSAWDLKQLLELLDESDAQYPYSVATLDVFATGIDQGQGVLVVGDHAEVDDLPAKYWAKPLAVSGPPKINLPITLPDLFLNRLSMRMVNNLILKIQAGGGDIAHYEKFIYPLDFVDNWNRGYGKRGFTQYQFVIPFDDALPKLKGILDAIQNSGQLPFLNVLKRMGKESGGLLSFPFEGYTLAIDFPLRPGLDKLLATLDQMVLDAGGRVYLGKDAFLTKDMFRQMYPQWEDFKKIKDKVDPEGKFTSNLGRRVGLC